MNNTPKKPRLSVLPLAESIKVVITEDFLNKVKFLCNSVRSKEWSGIVWYKHAGTIKDIENFSITPIDILLMDIGTQSHTEYKFTHEVTDFVMKKELFMYKFGHIHSHNTMSVFFSGEDDNELNHNCDTHNYYFSLIVNNYMDMIAKVVFRAKPHTFICPDEDGEDYDLPVTGLNDVRVDYQCTIEMPNVSVEEEFKQRFAEINKRTEERLKTTPVNYTIPGASKGNNTTVVKGLAPTKPGIPPKPNKIEAKSGWEEYIKDTPTTFEDPGDVFDCDDFICYVFRLSKEKKNDTVQDALFQANFDFTSGTSVIDTIMTNYVSYYDEYYNTKEKGLDPEHFLDVMEEVIAACDYYDNTFGWLANLSSTLRSMGNKFEENLSKIEKHELAKV